MVDTGEPEYMMYSVSLQIHVVMFRVAQFTEQLRQGPDRVSLS